MTTLMTLLLVFGSTGMGVFMLREEEVLYKGKVTNYSLLYRALLVSL